MSIAQKLRDMHALAADSCDPEFNRALIEAADEIEALRSLNETLGKDLIRTAKERDEMRAAADGLMRHITQNFPRWEQWPHTKELAAALAHQQQAAQEKP